MRHCLVTGAAGFVGSHLVRHLQEAGLQVRCVVRTAIAADGGAGDVAAVGDFAAPVVDWQRLLTGIDTVFHLAATAHTEADEESYRHDFEGTCALVKAAGEAGVRRFVFVSSTRAMEDPGNELRDESWDAWPVDPYGYWKRRTEQQLLENKVIGHVAILRPCMVYGCGMKGNLLQMLRAIRRGYFPPVPVVSAVRSMVAVDDLVSALLLVAQHPGANRSPLIVADGYPYTVRELYLATLACLGRRPPGFTVPSVLFTWLGRFGDALRFGWSSCPFTSERLMRLLSPAEFSSCRLRGLGWQPQKNFLDELPSILTWMESG